MNQPDHADVLVIGAGASGVVNSLVLARAGCRVVCLDQGGWTEPARHPHYGADFVYRREGDWSPEPSVRKGADDYPVEGGQSHALMWNGVGGSTNVYASLWPRLRPSDFRKGVEHGLAPDWPLSYEDLAPFYDEADRLVGVSGLAGDLGMPPRSAYPCRPLPMRATGRAIAAGFERLGWHWWPMPAGDCLGDLRRAGGLQRLRQLRLGLSARVDGQDVAVVVAACAGGGGGAAGWGACGAD